MTTVPLRSQVAEEHTWQLETIYATDTDWERDFSRVASMIPELEGFTGHLADSAQAMLRALTTRDQAGEILGRLIVYANMRLHEDGNNSTYQALASRAGTLANDVSTATAFMTPEILAVPRERIGEFLRAESGLRVYEHAFDEIDRLRAHILPAEQEALLAQAAELGDAPERIFELFNDADLRLPIVHDEQGNEVQLTRGNYVPRFLESRSRAVRREAFEAMLGTYESYRNTLAATLAAQVKRDVFFAHARHYKTALEAALDPHNIPVNVYDSLIDTVERNLPLLGRYLDLRKRVLGLEELHMYDLYVPLVPNVEYKVKYAEAQERVAEALAPLGERYVNVLRGGFASRWIDVFENRGKRSGAYSWGSYGTNPFVLLNYQESMDSMFTLAHEMGHAMHSFFTWETQPYPYSSYTLFVAEVASTLNEALLTHYLLETTTDPSVRMYVLNHALETFRGTLFRQTMFAEFERETHARTEHGEALTPELLRSVNMALNEKYYGAAVHVDGLIGVEWARIPHFYSNFYVYQYATGISASSALASQIIREGQPAVDRYLRFLSSGSSEYSIDLLRNAGVDLSTPRPVQQALDTFKQYLDQLEDLL